MKVNILSIWKGRFVPDTTIRASGRNLGVSLLFLLLFRRWVSRRKPDIDFFCFGEDEEWRMEE